MRNKFSYILFLILICDIFNAQEDLTIDAAIKIGLEKNYSVLIAKNNK